MEKILFLLSGGMDSTTLAYWLHKEVGFSLVPVYIMYGSNHMDGEMASTKKIVDKMKTEKIDTEDILYIPFNIREVYAAVDPTMRIPLLQNSIPDSKENAQRSTVVPFRNLLMLTLLAGVGEIKKIFTLAHGAVADDNTSYKDCREDFFESAERTLSLGCTEEATKFKIHRPFVKKSKIELVKWGLENNVPFELTTTCYRGKAVACGNCDACVERLNAFKAAGAKDPLIYFNF